MARFALALLFASALPFLGIDPAHAEDDDYAYEDAAPDPEDYEEELDPYGEWVEHPEYGPVWHPAVATGWRPYMHGHWAWTPAGWTWISTEPWGWTFHYGRWAFAPAWGWVWVPGTVWGPAWVDWYWGDGYVGWAPLAPFSVHVSLFDHFVFVRDHDFCAPRVVHHVVHHHRVPRHVVHHWRGRGRGFHAPDRHRIERVSRHPVRRLDRRPTETEAPWHRRSGSHLARKDRQHDGRLRDGRGKAPGRNEHRGLARGEPRRFDRPEREPRGRHARPEVERGRERPARRAERHGRAAPPSSTSGWARPTPRSRPGDGAEVVRPGRGHQRGHEPRPGRPGFEPRPGRQGFEPRAGRQAFEPRAGRPAFGGGGRGDQPRAGQSAGGAGARGHQPSAGRHTGGGGGHDRGGGRGGHQSFGHPGGWR
jgi:hypothetical protein